MKLCIFIFLLTILLVLANGRYIKSSKLKEDLEPFVINPVQDYDEFSENLSPSLLQRKYFNFSSRNNIFERLSQLNKLRTKSTPRLNTKKLLSKNSTRSQKLVMPIEAENIPLTRKSYNMIPEKIDDSLHKANIPSEYFARIDADYMRKKEHEDIQREIEADYSILDDDNEIAILDDQQLYKTFTETGDLIRKRPALITKPRRVNIKDMPERKDLEASEELEFIETSEEIKQLRENIGGPLIRMKRPLSDPLADEDMVSYDMPLGFTPQGLEDLVGEYFWGDFGEYDYKTELEADKKNKKFGSALVFEHFFVKYPYFDVISGIKSRENVAEDLHLAKDFEYFVDKEFKDHTTFGSQNPVLISPKRRPFSVMRATSKRFQNIFCKRKKKKIIDTKNEDVKRLLIESDDAIVEEYPLLIMYPVSGVITNIKKEITKVIPKAENTLVDELYKEAEMTDKSSSYLFDYTISKKLFPELAFDDIPNIEGIPIDDIYRYSVVGVIPGISEFESTIDSVRRELLILENNQAKVKDDIDSKLVRRHPKRKGLPPMQATDEEFEEWEMMQEEKDLQDEYDKFNRRKIKLEKLPTTPLLLPPKLEVPSTVPKQKGRVVISEDEAQLLIKREKEILPLIMKKTDDEIREKKLRHMRSIINRGNAITAQLKNVPESLNIERKNKKFILDENQKETDSRLERPHTVAMTHIDTRLKSEFNQTSK
ncbi:uncharacterized protein CMU_034270 [Cryptosporidium muris RN66]|uniref:Uncharacterized protein n=1 Tax=Cryptosporidium muris (strain RN66) TaxID=441375 RepID=B6AFQ0_CRYMR|nr:uncharacterized protein CMU_034270 [Cryptosporidium muris RN66]EEA07041.1 hypothetical protein CMU_034270 [Cryptosporidium muris RN66]|eukprot:XP_002141390.1 hypothetical protein [Cryptosporidium muris RN66]